MELTDAVKRYLRLTAEQLSGADLRLFMARTVRLLGRNGQRQAQRELGWNRGTVRKGMHELDSGITCLDNFSARGRKRVEDHLPNLLDDIRHLVDPQCQIDPSFESQRLYARITAAEVRRQLIARKGYDDAQLPCEETIRQKMHQLGYSLHKVAKSRPKKSCPRPTPSSSVCAR